MIRFSVLALCLATSGCAFTVHDVQTNYRYSAPVSTRLAPRDLQVGPITDQRGVENPRMIMNMTNLNGDTTSGGWQAEKPLSEILRDGVIQGLSAANVRVQSANAGVVLRGELLDFNVKTIMGMWEGTHQGKMTAKFQLTNGRTGAIVWQDTFVGSSQIKGGEGVVGVLKATLDSVVTKLISDAYFQQKLAEQVVQAPALKHRIQPAGQPSLPSGWPATEVGR